MPCEYNISQDVPPGGAPHGLEPNPAGSLEGTTALASASSADPGSTFGQLSDGGLFAASEPIPQAVADISYHWGPVDADGVAGSQFWNEQLLAQALDPDLDTTAGPDLGWVVQASVASGSNLVRPEPAPRLPSPPERSANGMADDDNSGSLSAPLLLHIQPKSILEPADHVAQLIAKSMAATAADVLHDGTGRRLLPGMFNIGEIARLVGEYPMRMLLPTFRSPFIHPTLFRQRPGGMPEHLAVALACVSMKLHMEAAGKEFVCETMSMQMDKLIKELPSVLDKHEEACIMLQASCIYGIEALIAANRFPHKLNRAVLHHEYLVRATKRLLQQIANTSPQCHVLNSFLALPISSSVSWKTWAVQESLRRTLFLIYVIHELLHVAETLDDGYFEPLFAESGVYESISLPASDALWRAESEDAWLAARRADEEASRQGSAATATLKLAEVDRRVASRDEPWARTEFPRLPELTRLILSAGPIYNASKRCTYSQPILNTALPDL